VDGGRSQPVETGKVPLGAIALVPGKSVAGVPAIQFHHQAVTGHLSHDRGTGNGEAEAVAVSYPPLRQGYLGQSQIVNEQVLGGRQELFYRQFHRQPRRPDYPVLIYDFMVGSADADGDSGITNVIE